MPYSEQSLCSTTLQFYLHSAWILFKIYYLSEAFLYEVQKEQLRDKE